MNILSDQNPQAVHLFEALLAVVAFGAALWVFMLLANLLLLRQLTSQTRYLCYVVAQLLLALSLPASLLLIPVPTATAPQVVADSFAVASSPVGEAIRFVPQASALNEKGSLARPGPYQSHLRSASATPAKTQVIAQDPIQSFVSRLEASKLARSAPLVCWGYALTVVLLLLRLVLAVHRGEALRASSEPIDDAFILATISRQARRIGLSFVPAFAACEITGPCVIGFIRPMLMLPLSLLANLSPEQVEMVIAHELAHIRRHDSVVTLLQRLAEAFLFFHPVVWYLSRRIEFERECCCDDMVLHGGPPAERYAAVLADVARLVLERIQIQNLTGAYPHLAATGKPSQLRLRVVRLLKGASPAAPLRNEPLRLARRSSLAVATLSLVMCALVVTSALASPHRSLPLPPSVVMFKGLDKIHEAAAAGTREELAMALANTPVDQPTRQGWSPLQIAAAVGREDICRDLLAARANVNFTDRQGRTPLFAALGMGPTAALGLVPAARMNIIRLLLTHGASVTVRDHSGMTPLDAAVTRGFTEAAAFLIQKGADIHIRDLHGRTALIYALEGVSPECVALLVKEGADVHTRDDAGRDCFDAVALQPEMRGAALSRAKQCASVLVQSGLQPKLCPAVALLMFDDVTALLRRRSPELSPDDFSYRNYSPLTWAVCRGDARMVKLLLDAGANPNKNDALGTAVALSTVDGDTILRMLLDAKAKPDVRDTEGSTPLRIAVWQLNVPVIKLLLSYGANPAPTDYTGRTPSDYIPDDIPAESRKAVLDALAEKPELRPAH